MLHCSLKFTKCQDRQYVTIAALYVDLYDCNLINVSANFLQKWTEPHFFFFSGQWGSPKVVAKKKKRLKINGCRWKEHKIETLIN